MFSTSGRKNGAHISFEHDNCQLIYSSGIVFNITQRGCLYYLKNIVSARNATYDLHTSTWYKILGHSNESDIKKLPNLVKGMKIKPTPNFALNCDICIQGKMSNDRNKTLDCKATKILAFVHSDFIDGLTHYNEISGWYRPLQPCKMFMDRLWNGVHFWTFSTVTCT